MSSIIFQKYGENSITQILDSLSELYPDCYACVTDLELNATWWSDKAVRL